MEKPAEYEGRYPLRNLQVTSGYLAFSAWVQVSCSYSSPGTGDAWGHPGIHLVDKEANQILGWVYDSHLLTAPIGLMPNVVSAVGGEVVDNDWLTVGTRAHTLRLRSA